MSHNLFSLTADLSGPNRDAAEAALGDFMAEQFGAQPRRTARHAGAGPAMRGGATPIELVTLALSVPSALLATLDLAERLKLKERIQRLLARLRAQAADAEVTLRLEGQPPLDLARASAAEVLAALETTHRR